MCIIQQHTYSSVQLQHSQAFTRFDTEVVTWVHKRDGDLTGHRWNTPRAGRQSQKQEKETMIGSKKANRHMGRVISG